MASLKFVQKNKPLANGEHIVYLRLIKDSKTKYYSTDLSCKLSQWNADKEEFYKSFPNFNQFNFHLKNQKNRALNILSKANSDGEDLSFEEFEKRFFDFKTDSVMTVYEFWEDILKDLMKSGRTGSERYYKECRQSFFKFVQNKNLKFKEFSPLLVSKYEVFLRERGNKPSGIAVRMRGLRSIYNKAINQGVVKKETYPFGLYKISKLKGEPDKRALAIEDVLKIKNFDTSNFQHLINTKNYFLFSYYMGGINFIDMMKLTWDNVRNNRIKYVRSKTKANFDVTILPPVQDILNYYKKNLSQTNYIFPILLRNDLNPSQIENRKAKTLKQYNKELKELANLAGIDEKLTSYVPRHSFATILKQKGIPIEVISELMGHDSVSTTMKYLKYFDKKVIDKAMDSLL